MGDISFRTFDISRVITEGIKFKHLLVGDFPPRCQNGNKVHSKYCILYDIFFSRLFVLLSVNDV